MPRSLIALAGAALLLIGTLPSAADDAASANREPSGRRDRLGIEFFEKHVRPLLARHCYECHSSKSKDLKGSLSLESMAGWTTGGDSGPALVPGKPDESLLIEALRYESYEMPPAGKLADADIDVFVKWIEMGAPDPRTDEVDATGPATSAAEDSGIDFDQARRFWAFQLPEPHRPPGVSDAAWPQTGIDRFILARLEESGLAPSPAAGPLVWLRRITFDLTGLPPAPDEMASLREDDSPETRQRVIDRLLASPEFGRHWGRHWLDVARYADSNGSDFNATFFEAWRYRDYVVDAFNHDQPFDQFTREQIAGDLLPYRSDRERTGQLIATTFLMIGPKMLSERDKARLTMDVVDEQIDSVGRAFLGLTLGCARCHDHKFDPIPTADYYALAGIFQSTITLEGESQEYVSTWRPVGLPISKQHAAALERFESERSRLAGAIVNVNNELAAAAERLAALEAGGQGITVDDSEAEIVGQWKDSKYSPHFVGEGYLHDEKTGKGEKSIKWAPDIPKAGMYNVRISFAGGGGRADNVPVIVRHADGTEQIPLDQTRTPAIEKLFQPLGTFRFDAGKTGFVKVSTEGTSGYVIADAVQFIPVSAATDDDRGEPSPELAAARTAVTDLKDRVAAHEQELKQVLVNAPPPRPQAMAVREAKQVGDTAICIRGEVEHRGPVVERGFLTVCSDSHSRVANKQQSGRAELAEWITRPDHPLTSRVIVNRIWLWLLGEGLVRSVDNFGHLGKRPTHPELLDTLAVGFVEDGWSVKRLVRQIVASRAYGQSSYVEAGAFSRSPTAGAPNHDPQLADPENHLLWRAHRKRLPAEALRDAMLAAGGRLDRSPDGSPVAGFGTLVVDNSSQAASGQREESTRRSLYLPIIRNELPEVLSVFDFADPDFVTGRRSVTNVPAQALFLLNSTFVRESAEATAGRILGGLSDGGVFENRQFVDRAYEVVLSRQPNDAERQRALQYIESVATGDRDVTPDQRVSALAGLVQALFSSTEFRMLD